MNRYKIIINREYTVWEKTEYIVRARSMTSAKRKIDMGEGYDAKGVMEGDNEVLYETMEGLGNVELIDDECEKLN